MAVSGQGCEGGKLGHRAEGASRPGSCPCWFGRGRVAWLWGPALPPPALRPGLPSWVLDAILGQGAATGGSPHEPGVGGWGKKANETERAPPAPFQGSNTYSTGFAVERGGRTLGMERKVGNHRGGSEGSGCPQEGRFQESEMQFGSPRAAGPSDGGLGEAGGGPWTHASSVRAEGEGGQGGLGEGSRGEGGTRTAAACGSEARGLPGRGAEDPARQPLRGLVLHCADAKLSRTRLHRPSGGACA